ncbi:DUF4982 domain-containing protein [Bifidobacterium amazonense]|uniref:DUF4982 domain-containing protein n=1 Tax=Bifidobacterium amazonense TaxID=2809027 RepID=A0ABS9VWU4_9BIFI|nr:sugar-binding domain-containing protein [Bifidobacterium amazonense]MCH9276386.1 DUF4982 domain-containing protein [Bifidobacterium amazonense]
MNAVRMPIMDGWEFSEGPTPANAGTGRPVDLPHDFVINHPVHDHIDWGVDQAFREWQGTGWYRRTIHIDAKREGYRYYLDFDGVYENARVSVNGTPVGGWNYGYSPFRLDVTDAVFEGDNDILVCADNNEAPTDRWYSGSGIYRTVTWMELPERHLDERDVIVRQHVDWTARSADLTVDVGTDTLRGETVVATLRDSDGETVAEARGQGRLRMHVDDARLWSAENPYLYTLTLALPEKNDASSSCDMLDGIDLCIGLRDIRFDAEQGMIVNGRRTIFRGVCLHQDAGCVGSASTKELMRNRLEQLKDMGCNGLRLAHHAHPRQMLDLADEMGFYVYAEPFDKWESGHYRRFFKDGWRADLAAMIRRDRNRPSIVMWGVGNEVENQAKRSMLAILRDLVAEAHRLDDTGRPVGCAMSPHFQTETADTAGTEGIIQVTDDAPADQEIDDPDQRVARIKLIADITDVTVLNYAEQWYGKVNAAIPDKPIFGSETYQWFVGHEWQMQDYISENPNLVPERDRYVIGGAIWAGFDYLGESMGWPSKGWSGALIRTNGVPKAGYWLMRSYWCADGEPFVHFMAADYTQPDENVKEHWDIPPFVGHWEFPQYHKNVVPYLIATNCDEVCIRVNQRELYVRPVREFANRAVIGYLPYQPGVLTVIGYRDGHEVCRETTNTPISPAVTLEFADTTRRVALPETMELPARRGYERLLSVRCLDAAGNPVFREFAPVRFRIAGPAGIIAVDNGNLMGNEPYGQDTIHLHQGVASVMIRLTGEPGRIILSADAPGMHTATQTIIAG